MNKNAIRILFVGNEHSLDCMHYVGSLAAKCSVQMESACLVKQEGTVRNHARNVVYNNADYDYWKWSANAGWIQADNKVTVAYGLSDGQWDAIVLQQGLLTAGMYGTYNNDLTFLLDYLADVCPNTPVYWNMTWAYQQDVTGSRAAELETLYESSQAVMYNAIVDALEQNVVGDKARFASRFAGWFPVGAAIQNLRGIYGDTLTRDGLHLSEQAGHLAAGMTILKVLSPELDLRQLSAVLQDESVTAQICSAVESACADLSRPPVRLETTRPIRVEDVSGPENVTVAQVPAPYKLHFPDSAVTRDGALFVSAYENVYHYPDTVLSDNYAWQGSGRLVIWKSTDNGKTFDTALVIDEDKLNEWGVVNTRNRYTRWKQGENDYILNADPRDPNFTVVYVDINGDGVKEEVLLYTFCMVNYHEEGRSHSLNMNWSVDGGKTWSMPQELESVNSPVLIKRGDMAVFSDGQILVPTYFRNKIVLLLMEWNAEQGKWVNVHDTVLPDPAPEKTGKYEYNEMSLVTPDPDTDVVYGFIRANAAVVKSFDRGRTWNLIGMEDGLIHQPGFTLLDRDRAFVTWARIIAPRTVYGKVYYLNADWKDTVKRTIYASPDVRGHDMADPSCRLLADGRIHTVSYDTAYRSIVGTFDDPNNEEFLPVEMNPGEGKAILYESKAITGTQVRVDEKLPGSYTVCVCGTFEKGGELAITMATGTVVRFREDAHGIKSGVPVCMYAVAVGESIYRQVTSGGEPDAGKWVRAARDETAAGGAVTCTGNGVSMERICVSHRVSIQMQDSLAGIAGGRDSLHPIVCPLQTVESWSTSDPNVARVENGIITYIGSGCADITFTAGGVSAVCHVTVSPMPAELAGEGETKLIFCDDYQQFPVGENAFWHHMEENGYCSNGTVPTADNSYDIEQEDGKHYLKLTTRNAKRTWHRVCASVTGDYTLQFSFRFNGGRTIVNAMAPGHCLYVNLWQQSGINAFFHLTPEGLRCEYQRADGEMVTEPELFHDEIVYPLNIWHTIRITRVNGGLYAKVWRVGEPEPEQWSFISQHTEFDTNNTACPRLLYYTSGPVARSVHITDFQIRQQSAGKGEG